MIVIRNGQLRAQGQPYGLSCKQRGLLCSFGECQLMPQLIARRLLVTPLINRIFQCATLS
jgi:hypothetical protein